MMGELVQNDIRALLLIAAACQRVEPRKHDRPVAICQPRHLLVLGDNPIALRRLRRTHKTLRVQNDRGDAVEEAWLVPPQGQQGGLAGDGDFHLVGNFQPRRAIPAFLGDKHLNERLHPLLVRRRQVHVLPDVAYQKRQPRLWKCLGEESSAAPAMKPIENHLPFVRNCPTGALPCGGCGQFHEGAVIILSHRYSPPNRSPIRP